MVDLPPGGTPLGCKWIFNRKMKTDGSIDKYKATLVLITLIHTPITRITSIRMLIAIIALHNLEIHQIDVKTTFINGDLNEKIYME